MDACEQDDVKLKSYFYALRTVLSAKWIIERGTIPPVDFMELLPIAPTAVQEKAAALMTIKANQDEKYLHPKEPLITNFLLETLAFNEEHVKGLGNGNKMAVELDGVFRENLKFNEL